MVNYFTVFNNHMLLAALGKTAHFSVSCAFSATTISRDALTLSYASPTGDTGDQNQHQQTATLEVVTLNMDNLY